MAAGYKADEGTAIVSPEILLKHYKDTGRQIKTLRDILPQEMNNTKQFLHDSETARRILQAFATMVGWYKDGFQSKINDLQNMTVHAESNAPRFTGDFLSVKMNNLRKSALIRAQKSVEMDQMTTPTFQAVYMTLSEMHLEIDQIDTLLQKASRNAIMKQMQQQSRTEDFNFAANGLRITTAEFERFQSMTPEQQDAMIQRDQDALQKATTKWNGTIQDTEDAILQIENGTLKTLRLTYQSENPDHKDDVNGVIRLMEQDGP